ncbi:hypothetical protein [Aneurinibacillus aneurinilyticus]|jgi:hypothetical protein|uniref:hypothetical protein n=1 Tax=Aneurinibacillus aneurinilyticus TaxID=1391 RepID=UPI0023F1091C|nr:hypothetical protein [Aneurinibacillus aneurinilyticus]MCI1694168.1 hypothetical protein [Aneurinibacillus aneurinilyticus]MED0672477.1 hypothetical protein [Aneurinibacillus aneurinilyticus]
MLREALNLWKDRISGHIDARDTERATLLSWPSKPQIQVDGDPVPYEYDKLIFAEYLQDRKVEAYFEIGQYMEGEEAKGSVTGVLANGVEYESGAEYKQVPRSSLQGVIVIPSPLQVGDRLIVSRLTGQRYYVHGKDVRPDGG